MTTRKTLTLSVDGKLARMSKILKRNTGKELTSDNVVEFTTNGVESAIYGKQSFERSRMEDRPEDMPCMHKGRQTTYGTLSLTEAGRERLKSDVKGHERSILTHQRRAAQKNALIIEGKNAEIARLRQEVSRLKRDSFA